jgi:WD40 repeat protein
MALSDQYFASGSFDSSIKVTTSASLFDFETAPEFVSFNEHTDYILSLVISGDFLLSAASDSTIRFSLIRKGAVQLIRKVSVEISVHCLFVMDHTVFLGFADGRIDRRGFSSADRVDDGQDLGSAVKRILVVEGHLFAGLLDGRVFVFSIASLKTPLAVFDLGSRIVGLCLNQAAVLAFTHEGNVVDVTTRSHVVLEMLKAVSCAVPGRNGVLHICFDDSALCCLDHEWEIIQKVPGEVRYVKALRIPQTAHILCKTTGRNVEL